jgi:hypothetical protein
LLEATKANGLNRSNARNSVSKPIAIDSLQTAFALYDLIEEAEADGGKLIMRWQNKWV